MRFGTLPVRFFLIQNLIFRHTSVYFLGQPALQTCYFGAHTEAPSSQVVNVQTKTKLEPRLSYSMF